MGFPNFPENVVKMDKDGCIKIPKDIRKYMGIEGETLLLFQYSYPSNTITFEKAYATCVECGSPEGVFPFGGMDRKACPDCVLKFFQKLQDGLENRKECYDKNDKES